MTMVLRMRPGSIKSHLVTCCRLAGLGRVFAADCQAVATLTDWRSIRANKAVKEMSLDQAKLRDIGFIYHLPSSTHLPMYPFLPCTSSTPEL